MHKIAFEWLIVATIYCHADKWQSRISIDRKEVFNEKKKNEKRKTWTFSQSIKSMVTENVPNIIITCLLQ